MRLNIKRFRVPVEFGGEADVDLERLFAEEDLDDIVATQFMVFPFNESSVQVVVIAHLLSELESKARAASVVHSTLDMMDDIDDEGM
jgi:hypothetical protein